MPGSERPTNATARRCPESPGFSPGEVQWISTVDVETLTMAHPQVLEAAVIAVPHPQWVERPLACVVPKAEHRDSLSAAQIIAFLRPRLARFWLPDAVVFIEADPKTSVGKFDKK